MQNVSTIVQEARRLMAADRLGDARRLLTDLLRRSPREIPALEAMADLYELTRNNFAQARMLADLTRLQPGNAAYHGRLGQAYQDLGWHEESQSAYERAIALDPRSAAPWCGLAQVHERMHQLDEAFNCLSRAAELSPEHSLTQVFLAQVEARLRRVEDAEQRLQRVLAAAPRDDVAARAWIELARLLDRTGRYAEAWKALERGKALQLAQTSGSSDESGTVHRAAMISAWNETDQRRWAAERAEQARLALIVGFPRSGTTLAEQVLGQHPEVVTLEEVDLFARAEIMISSGMGAPLDYPLLKRLPPPVIGDIRTAYFNAAEERLRQPIDGRLLIDKMPLNFLLLPTVGRLFPEARVVMALRDPRDICVSCFFQLGGVGAMALPYLRIESIAEKYAASMRAWLALRGKQLLSMHELRYETFVNAPEAELARLLEFLKLEKRDDLLPSADNAQRRYVRTPSYEAVSRPVYASAVGRWRHYEQQLAPVMPILRPLCQELGYEC